MSSHCLVGLQQRAAQRLWPRPLGLLCHTTNPGTLCYPGPDKETETMANKVRKPQPSKQRNPPRAVMQAEIDRILDRLDTEIPAAQKRMDELLRRLHDTRTTIAA